jgi:hypothetical protein
MGIKSYSEEFFSSVESTARPSAEVIVPIVLALTGAKNVVDFDCGTGQWLGVTAESGVMEVLGLDGEWVTPSQLKIAPHWIRRRISGNT